MKTFLALFQLLPKIIEAVVALQKIAIPGANKKDIILHTISVAAEIGESIPVPLVQAISLMVDRTAASLKTGEATTATSTVTTTTTVK